MNSSQIIDDKLKEELTIDGQSRTYLKTASEWGNSITILGFIICGLVFICGIFSVFSNNAKNEPFYVGTIIIVTATLFAIPFYYLHQFSSNVQSALKTENQISLTSGIQNLKSLFKYIGVSFILLVLGLIIGFIYIGFSFDLPNQQ